MRSMLALLALVVLSSGIGCDRLKGLAGAEGSSSATPASSGTLLPTAGATAASAPGADPYKVGDRIQVSWQGSCYPAKILKIAKPGVYFITYEGYDHSWDETIGTSRICGGK